MIIKKSLWYILGTIILNFFVIVLSGFGDYHFLVILNFAAVLFACPILFSHWLDTTIHGNTHPFISFLNSLLFVFNGIVLIFCTLALLMVSFMAPILLIISPYLMNGWWVFIQFGQKKKTTTEQQVTKTYWDDDLLDDEFGVL